MHSRPIVFFDLETTGVSAARDRITDIGAVRVFPDGTRDKRSMLVNPGVPIPANIRAITGISDDMVADAPRFEDIAERVDTWLGDSLLIAHNATFDIGFMREAFRRAGRPRALPHVCSLRTVRKLMPELPSRSLGFLAESHGLRFAGRSHRALPDAEMLSRLWFVWREKFGAEVFDAVAEKMRKA